MKVYHGIEGLLALPPGTVMSIGNFDGVHRGHLDLLHGGRQLRQRMETSLTIVTFEPHPLTVLRPHLAPPRLTPRLEKHALLEAQGVDYLVELPPAPEVLNLTAEKFWHILRDQVKPSHMIEGPSFTFGKGREGTIERLRQWTAESGVVLHIIKPVTAVLVDLQIVDVNSSLIRWLLSHGRTRDAAICLHRPYQLQGTVVEGHRRGRTIGVPTANLNCHEQMVPMDGVYAGKCTVDGIEYAVAMSIGRMPTFGEYDRQIEAHLIGYDGDLYGRTLQVDVTEWLREQRKYDGLDGLTRQLARDIAEARSLLAYDPTHEPAQA